MRLKMMAAISAVAMTMGLASCQTIPEKMSLADYCANADHATKDVCKVNVEIDGQKTALASTNMSLSQARSIADKAMSTATGAQAAADRAQQAAMEAQKIASNPPPLTCETKTVRRAKSGSCSPGYKLVSCTQTHYTKKAGGMSIMRSIDDAECTFQAKVLEIQARCCADGQPPATEVKDTAPATPAPTAPATSS
jgi:2',3'-cyclic-nucleotide 2'-phosphodiesterase (5'-nucleotidase family)